MQRIRIEGKPLPVRGDDIDTDRIIPARFLRCVTFEGLGEHLFEDDRKLAEEVGKSHPINENRYEQAEILLVNKNFGCGSSREHAPQAIQRWGKGIKAIIGESFAQIFFGNCGALGIPCVQVEAEAIREMLDLAEKKPEATFAVDLEKTVVEADGQSWPLSIDPGLRTQFLEGKWDTLALLKKAEAAIGDAENRLPYMARS